MLACQGGPSVRNSTLDDFDYGVSAPKVAQQFELSLAVGETILTYIRDRPLAHR
jgi:hypothetical protein